MNYRHAFHAGNFADLVKHAVLTALLAELTRGGPLTVIDTHAGAGVYDLAGEAAMRTGEGQAIAILMTDAAAPAVFQPLKAAVARLNETGLRHYPGSPDLIAHALRARDQLIACETRRDDFETLREVLRRPAGAFAMREDGWETARRRTPRPPAATLVHIDPPYEARDDGARAVDAVRQVLARNRGAVVALWAPIKELAAFDALVTAVHEAADGAAVLLIEARLRAPDDPLRMNGCAMVVVNPPAGVAEAGAQAAQWVAAALGERGAEGRAEFLGPRPAQQRAGRLR
jgi:23S rRNA (adenine2030-N6)-methyltransferase